MLLFRSPALCAPREDSPPSDAELLSSVRTRIDQHRKGDGSLQFLRQNGQPVSNAKVTIEQLAHEFLLGCNLFQFGRCADQEQEQQYRRRFCELFNYCTLGFYWAGYEVQRGKPNYDYTDQVLEWTKSQNIVCKGHPLVWDHPAASPQWLPADPAEIAAAVTVRVKDIVSRFRSRIDIWDVVNEPTHLPDGVNKTKMAAWGAELGPLPYTAEPLRVARTANPAATLLVNDYRTDPHYYQILSRLLDANKPLFHAIGIQSHMHQGPWPLHKLQSVCHLYSQLALPVHFTETTILSGSRGNSANSWDATNPEAEERQANAAAAFYSVLFAHPEVQAITWWDFSDYHSWQNAPAGLLRTDMSPKPAYEALFRLIKGTWWTKTAGSTDSRGRLSWRGFYGRYRITVESSGDQKVQQEVFLQRGKLNQFEIRT